MTEIVLIKVIKLQVIQPSHTCDFFASKASVMDLVSKSEYCVHTLLSASYSHLYSSLLTRAFLAGLAVSPLACALDFPAEIKVSAHND